MKNRDKVLAVVCIALHLVILWRTWVVMEMTPRIIEVKVEACYL